MKKLRYFAEYICLKTAFFFLGLMNLDKASHIAGKIGRIAGPRLGISRVAELNIRMVMPELSDSKRDQIIADMWENLGRIIGEYPHMEQIGRERVEICGHEILDNLVASSSGSITFGAHLANWEMTSYALRELGPCPVVRIPNNPWVRRMIEKGRGADLIPKSAHGTRQLVKYLKDNRHVGILIDQKYNEGISVPFLGLPAMTSPAFVQLAKKFSCPLVPVRFERLEGARFRVTLYESLSLNDDEGRPMPDEEIIRKAHKYLEEWIRERPEQWIWIHKRWKYTDPDNVKEP